jgi:nucleotide-binding universal stress UspA family protein
MHDDFEPALDPPAFMDGATPRQFSRVFVGGAEGEGARRDALALAAALAPGFEGVAGPARADLIVVGSAADGPSGRVALDPAERAWLEGALSPAAVAPQGFAYVGDRGSGRIVVGLDGGRGSLAALETAQHLARTHGAELRLIGVAELEPGADPPRADPRELSRLSRRLSVAGEGLAGVASDTDVREGLPDRVLADLAADADLLVIGSRTTYGGGGRLAIGDVAAGVLGDAPCPTLIVPAP